MFSRPALLSVLLILAQSIASPQEPKIAATQSPRFDRGAYASDTYSNDCLGFSFHMPAGWLAKSQGINGPARAIHQQGGGLGLLLIEQPKQGTFGNTITLYATEAKDQTPQEFVSKAVQAQIKRAPGKSQLLRDATVVEYGDRKFFRSDYSAALPYGGHSAYRSLVFTRFRNYFIGEMVSTGSEEELNHAVDSLRGISFLADTPNPSCEK